MHPLWAVVPSVVIIGAALVACQLRSIDRERRALAASVRALAPIRAALARTRAGAAEAHASLDVLARR